MLPLWTDADSGVRVARLTGSEEVESLVRLFEGVAAAENWQPDGALRRWVDRSVYFGIEVNGLLAGGLQLVLPNLQGALPCHSVWPEILIASSWRCAHIAILALDTSFRGQRKLFWPLTAEMWRYCVGERIATLFLEVTPKVRPIYDRMGWPLKIEGELREHWGEDCYCCSLGVPEVAASLLRRSEQSLFYQQIVSQMFRVTLSKNQHNIHSEDGFQALAS